MRRHSRVARIGLQSVCMHVCVCMCVYVYVYVFVYSYVSVSVVFQ